MAATLDSGFCLWVMQNLFSNTSTRTLALGTSASTEVSGGDYQAQPGSSANWIVATENSRATAYNRDEFSFPVNSTASTYNASHFLVKSNSEIAYSHAFELGTLAVATDTRVRVTKYSAGLHRGIFVQLWEASA